MKNPFIRAVCKNCEKEVTVSLKKTQVEISQKNVFFDCPNCKENLVYPDLPDEVFNKIYHLAENVIFIPSGKDLETKPSNSELTLDDLIDFHFELDKVYNAP